MHNECKTGKYKELQGEKGKDSHHIIQDPAVRDEKLSGYSRNDAPAIALEGPASKIGTEHYNATQFQRHNSYGGTYRDERKVAFISLRKAGKTKEEAYEAIKYADEYFIGKLGWDMDKVLRIPGNRR
ncbi:MAG: hypothetical protein IJ806_03915 [Ruminococcus sp.]|nr:hypothetical protein [Ruminococcus sp.]